MAAPKTKEVKKPLKTERTERQPMHFAFGRKNFMILFGGIALLIFGYIALSGGGSKDPNQFSEELFSSRRMVLAPILLMLGYLTIAVAIMTKPEASTQNNEETQQ